MNFQQIFTKIFFVLRESKKTLRLINIKSQLIHIINNDPARTIISFSTD